MDHGIRAFDKGGQALRPIERAVQPRYMRLPWLGAAGEGADCMAAFPGETDEVAADEAGAAGDRQSRQSITI
jgi:hypothetical protein